MADKTKTSPLKQGWGGSIMGNMVNQANATQGTSSLMGMPISTNQTQPNTGSTIGGIAGATAAAAAAAQGTLATATQGTSTKPKTLGAMIKTRQNPISPKALSNQNNIRGIFGSQNPGTFTRNMQTPLQQTIQPPSGVEEAITPTYDLSNQ